MKINHYTILTFLLFFFAPILGPTAHAGSYKLKCTEINSGVGGMRGSQYDARVGVGITGGIGRLTGGLYQFDLGFMSCPLRHPHLIPAVSMWGMVTMTLFVLTIYKIKFRRHTATH